MMMMMKNYNLKSDFLSCLQERGFLYQCSNFERLDDIMSKNSIKAYIGFDCSANSLHIGSLIQILLLRYLYDYGHTPYILLGGGTSLVGDPSGKNVARQILTKFEIEHNCFGIKQTLESFFSLTHDNKNKPVFLNNLTWLENINYLEFLREYGIHFSINRMLTFDNVKTRLENENSLSFLEFNYMLLQATDFYYLHKNHDVILQLGGSDQWGNIVNGIDINKKLLKKEVFALTSTLFTKADGTKMGKTANGAIWLTKDKLSAWEFYQYFRNIDDNDVIKCLKLYTQISLKEIAYLETLKGKDINEAKKILAFEVTELVHGKADAIICQKMELEVFENKSGSNDLPSFELSLQDIEDLSIVNLLVNHDLLSSNSEAKKLIANKGIKINDMTIQDSFYKLKATDFLQTKMKLSLGKKKHYIFKLT